MNPKIFGFVNGGTPGWYIVEALSEDGYFLAQHLCSHPSFGPHDIGVTSDWKHEIYRAHYPEGFEVVWVEDPKTHEGLKAAYERHLVTPEEEYNKRMQALKSQLEAEKAGAA